MFWALVAYFAVSVLIGINDTKALRKQDEYFSNLPAGDDGYFEKRKPIVGAHNLVFAPSLVIINHAAVCHHTNNLKVYPEH